MDISSQTVIHLFLQLPSMHTHIQLIYFNTFTLPSSCHFLSYAVSHHNMPLSYGARRACMWIWTVCDCLGWNPAPAFTLAHCVSVSHSLSHSLFSTPLSLPMLLSFCSNPSPCFIPFLSPHTHPPDIRCVT